MRKRMKCRHMLWAPQKRTRIWILYTSREFKKLNLHCNKQGKSLLFLLSPSSSSHFFVKRGASKSKKETDKEMTICQHFKNGHFQFLETCPHIQKDIKAVSFQKLNRLFLVESDSVQPGQDTRNWIFVWKAVWKGRERKIGRERGRKKENFFISS